MKIRLIAATSVAFLISVGASQAQNAQPSPDQRLHNLEEDVAKLTARVTELERIQNAIRHYAPGIYYGTGNPGDPQKFCKNHGFDILVQEISADQHRSSIVVCADPIPGTVTNTPLNH